MTIDAAILSPVSALLGALVSISQWTRRMFAFSTVKAW